MKAQEKVKEQVRKLNSFLLQWRQCENIKTQLRKKQMNPLAQQDPMVTHVVTAFSVDRKSFESVQFSDMKKFVGEDPARYQHLSSSVIALQTHFKGLFFDSTHPQLFKYVLQDIEHLFASAEIILKTHFRESFFRLRQIEDNTDVEGGMIDIDLEAEPVEESVIIKLADAHNEGLEVDPVLMAKHCVLKTHSSVQMSLYLSKIYRYLLNIRVVAVILMNLFWNQVKFIIRQRVVYDKEQFFFESYLQKGLHDGRLIKHSMFMNSKKGCKNLVAEFFKYQLLNMGLLEGVDKDSVRIVVDDARDLYFDIDNSDKMMHVLNLLTVHLPGLQKVDNKIDIEPLLLVFFQKLALTKQAKETLSRVSKNFFKQLKLEYRTLDNLKDIISTLLNFFEGQSVLMMSSQGPQSFRGGCSFGTKHLGSYEMMQVDKQINQSFIHFMFMHLCDSLVEEHTKFMQTLVWRKNYAIQENVDKFKKEVVIFNHFVCVLGHFDFSQCKFFAHRALRETQRQTRRLCEMVDHKIERAQEEAWQKSSGNSLLAMANSYGLQKQNYAHSRYSQRPAQGAPPRGGYGSNFRLGGHAPRGGGGNTHSNNGHYGRRA